MIFGASLEPEDFEYAPFSQRGGLGKAHQLFGEQLPKHSLVDAWQKFERQFLNDTP